jgi:hypothetical protein
LAEFRMSNNECLKNDESLMTTLSDDSVSSFVIRASIDIRR